MFRFTTRELVLITAIAAMGTAWLVDRQRLVAKNESLRTELTDLRRTTGPIVLQAITGADELRRTGRIDKLREDAEKAPPSPAIAKVVLFEVRHGDDARLRVRAMAILPYLNERQEAIEALRDAVRERGDSIGHGIVPQYATMYLAEMKATEAIEDVRAWIEFIKAEQPYDAEMNRIHLKSSERDLALLIAVRDAGM